MENKTTLFEDRRIRYAWNAEREVWFFSIADVVKALTDSSDEKQYLKKMKMRVPSLEANWGTICTLVQMVGMDGKRRKIQAADAEKTFLRDAEYYRVKGYTEGWINQRLQVIEMRKELTDEWKARGIEEERDYAILTNEMTKAWRGLPVRDYKQLKGLKKENLRNNMTNVEPVLKMLAEVTTTAISKSRRPDTK